jgi:hypothetical protein
MGFGRNGKQASYQRREVMRETQQNARTSDARAPTGIEHGFPWRETILTRKCTGLRKGRSSV